MLRAILIVGLGGFIGSVLRYLAGVYFQTQNLPSFPWATFSVNIIGSLLIGIIYGISERTDSLPADLRLFLAVGICGGFTTFSSFTNDAFLLMQGREWLKLSLYAGVSVFLGLLAVILGRNLIKIF
ncbi:MAG: fluoride efflux transporter CrcB [Bacteroidales bacterium]|nr:fluoride efflux transporter CrcB [Bacteroidales bacterium]